MTKFEKVEINGIMFNLGYQKDSDYSGSICEIIRDKKKYGALSIKTAGDELGFNSGLFATEQEATACVEARKWLNEHFNTRYTY